MYTPGPTSILCPWPYHLSSLGTKLTVDFTCATEAALQHNRYTKSGRRCEYTWKKGPFEFVQTLGSLRGTASRPYHFTTICRWPVVGPFLPFKIHARRIYVNRFPLYLRQPASKGGSTPSSRKIRQSLESSAAPRKAHVDHDEALVPKIGELLWKNADAARRNCVKHCRRPFFNYVEFTPQGF